MSEHSFDIPFLRTLERLSEWKDYCAGFGAFESGQASFTGAGVLWAEGHADAALVAVGDPLPAMAVADLVGIDKQALRKLLARHKHLATKFGRSWSVHPRSLPEIRYRKGRRGDSEVRRRKHEI